MKIVDNEILFDSIDELINSFDTEFQTADRLRWEMVSVSNTDLRAKMIPTNPAKTLFRGQHTKYSPCVSTISRGIKTNRLNLSDLELKEQNQILLGIIKSDWFSETIEQHPIFNWAKGQNVLVDKMALAQHYGIPTGFLDLTQDINVAAFFACCKFVNNAWIPMSEGEGVMYYISLYDFKKWNEFSRPIAAISHQPFPRPTQQWGWTFETFLGDDFEFFPFVKSLRFKHNFNSSNQILNKFKFGESLFPPDPLADVAYDINNSSVFPRQIAIAVIKDFSSDPKGIVVNDIDKKIEEISIAEQIQFLDQAPNYFTKERLDLAERIWNLNKERFFEGVTFRLVRTIKNGT